MRLFSVLVFILPAAVAAVPLAVKVTPRQAVSRIGDSLVAKCEVFCGETPRFLWKMLGDIPTFGVVKRNTASELVLDPVTIENEETFVCEASCGSSSGQNKLTVKVFSFPEDPVISGHGHLVAGKTVIVTCQVPRVYPPEHLKIEWLQNGRVVSEVNGMDEGGRSVQTVSSTHTFEPTAEDHGGNLSCRATLELPGVPDDQKTRESAVHLTVQTPPRKTTVSVSPAGELREGDPLTLLCQSDGEPACHLVLRRLTEDQYTELKSSVGSSLSHTIPSARLEDSGRYECEAINHHGSQTNTVEVVVRAPPRNTTVQVTPSWNVFQGQDVTVSCSTVSFPAAKAILRRLSDGNELSSPDCVFRLLNVTPGDAGSYQLSVSNELGQETEHFNLSVVAPPRKTTVSVSPAGELREGDPLTLLCQSDGEPACHLVLRRLTEDQYTELKSSVGSSLSHTIPSARLEDSGRYECEAINHHGSQTNTVEVVVRAPPRNTTVQVTPSWNVFQGQDVTVSCSTVSFPAAKAILRRLSDSNELSSPDCVFRLLNVTPGDAGSYQLSVSNELGQETEHFNLSVVAPPRKTTVSVSPAGELREGDPLTLLCQSDGEPACHLVLRRLTEDQYTELKSSVGSSLSHTIPSARLEDSGRYECEAINHHGSQTNTVEVVVRAPPRNTTVQVTPSWNVFQGQDVTVSCSTVSFPAAKAILRRLSDSNELSSPDCVFRLLNVTPGDAGSYQLSVSNELGQETEHFNLSVVEKYTNPPKEDPVSKVIPTVVASVSLLSIVTLLTSFLWKARRMSSYQMTASSTV